MREKSLWRIRSEPVLLGRSSSMLRRARLPGRRGGYRRHAPGAAAVGVGGTLRLPVAGARLECVAVLSLARKRVSEVPP